MKNTSSDVSCFQFEGGDNIATFTGHIFVAGVTAFLRKGQAPVMPIEVGKRDASVLIFRDEDETPVTMHGRGARRTVHQGSFVRHKKWTNLRPLQGFDCGTYLHLILGGETRPYVTLGDGATWATRYVFGPEGGVERMEGVVRFKTSGATATVSLRGETEQEDTVVTSTVTGFSATRSTRSVEDVVREEVEQEAQQHAAELNKLPSPSARRIAVDYIDADDDVKARVAELI